MTQHTPGPWKLDGTYLTTDNREGLVLGLFTEGPGLGHAACGNRRLIAAAPDLLAALREFIAWREAPLKGSGHAEYIMELELLARHAIAKAEGGQ